MQKILITLAALAVAGSASAVLNLTISQPINEFFTLNQGGTASVYGTVTGVGVDVSNYSFLPGTGFSFTPSSSFLNYIAMTTNADFGTSTATGLVAGTGGGLLGTITAGFTQGSFNNVLGVIDPTVITSNGVGEFDGENLTVQVTPEPASFAALGVGALALIRRRRKA